MTIWRAETGPSRSSWAGCASTVFPSADAAEFYTYQFLVRARPAARPDFGLTSIVIVTHNQLEYTRQCLDSIRQLTDEPYELIVVDNGSTDGTVEYLRALPDVRVIANRRRTAGFPAAVNQGIAVAAGRQVLLLNNDVVVTTGWLGRMLRALHSDPKIGLVGPRSNLRERSAAGRGRLRQPGRAGRICLGLGQDQRRPATRRQPAGRLLPVDPPGSDRRDRAAGRADSGSAASRTTITACGRSSAGYRAVIAGDAFVHHYGGRTFVGSGVDVAAADAREPAAVPGEMVRRVPDNPAISARRTKQRRAGRSLTRPH